MGGRGSLSSNTHKMYNPSSIKENLNQRGVRVYGTEQIKRKGLSSVVEVLETVQKYDRLHGKNINTVMIGKGNSISVVPNYVAKLKSGKEINLGNTLFIPKSLATSGKITIRITNKDTKIQITRNLQKQVAYEYGKAIVTNFKKTNPKAYSDLTRRVKALSKSPDSKVKVSNRVYKTSDDYVHDSVSSMLRNTRTRQGQDMIDLVHDYISSAKGTNFNRYGLNERQGYTTRKRRK